MSLLALVFAVASAGPPPEPLRDPAPPPASAQSAWQSVWMGMGSYCWTEGGKGVCVDTSLPRTRGRLRARAGEVVTFRLGFTPSMVRLTRFPGQRGRYLRPARVMHWRVRGRPRVLNLFVRARRGGDVSYAISVRVAP
jgi:hypothetical protein